MGDDDDDGDFDDFLDSDTGREEGLLQITTPARATAKMIAIRTTLKRGGVSLAVPPLICDGSIISFLRNS